MRLLRYDTTGLCDIWRTNDLDSFPQGKKRSMSERMCSQHMNHDILCPDRSFVSSYVTATAQNRFDFSLCDFAMSIYVLQSFRDFLQSIGFSESETTDEDIRSKDLSEVAEAVQVTIEAHNPSGLSGVWLADESVYEKYNELRIELEGRHSSYREWRLHQRPSEPAVHGGYQRSAGSEQASAAG